MKAQEAIVVADRTAPMDQILINFGYRIYRLPQQIPCPVHKLGTETKASARIYEDNHFVWCYTCAQQFRPTEIWSAQKLVSRSEAATQILDKWPVSSPEMEKILKDFTLPTVTPIPAAYSITLERHLKKYKRKVSLISYRDWAKRLEDFSQTVISLPENHRELALQSFLEQLNRNLTLLLKG